MGLGVALVTISDLGTSAISSLSFVSSLILPLSFGVLTMLMNFSFIIIQKLMMGKDFPKIQYLQILVAPIFGFSIDIGMFLFSPLETSVYYQRIIMILIGCCIMAISIVLQLKADVVKNSGEGLVKVISMKINKDFSAVKTAFDITLVLISVVLSLIALGQVEGIREGTVLAAVLVGPLTKVFRNLFASFKKEMPIEYNQQEEAV